MLTGGAAVIAAVTGAVVAYVNLPNAGKPGAFRERYLVLENVDIPRSVDFNELRVLARVSIGNRTWTFPFPQGTATLLVGQPAKKETYPLPSNTDDASIMLSVDVRATGRDWQELIQSEPTPIKALSSARITVFPINPLVLVRVPMHDKPAATFHFTITPSAP